MNTDTLTHTDTSSQVSRASAAFGWAAAITILFNSVLASAKDYYPPLNKAMAALTGHHWITHGLADVVLFFGLGLLLQRTPWAAKTAHLPAILVACVLAAAVGLLGWFWFF